MKKWTWILLALSVGIILFLWSIRENFQDTASLRGPPYGDSDYPTIVNLMSTALVTKLQDKFVVENPGQDRPDKSTLDGQRQLVDGTISDLMGDFHTSVYKPATTPLRDANVDSFLNTKSSPRFLVDNKAEIKKLLVAYFVTQPAGDANVELTDAQKASESRASNSGYADILNDLGQTETSEVSGSLEDSISTRGNLEDVANAGGSGNIKKGNIWGPRYTGMGDNAGQDGLGGMNTIGEYPTLIGPQPKESKMVEGAGITAISQNKSLVKSGTLPDPTSTGSDPNSQFFGTSRMPARDGGPGGRDGSSRSPGDKDLFPNPYQEFTPSVGSSKTEPVPYLSDFSAFLN
jgi:hypothetical protein